MEELPARNVIKYYTRPMSQNKDHARILFSRIGKLLFLTFALITAYLFALNGRYIQIDDELYFDKWTKTHLEIYRYETIK